MKSDLNVLISLQGTRSLRLNHRANGFLWKWRKSAANFSSGAAAAAAAAAETI